MYDWEFFRSKASGSTYKRFFDFLVDRYEVSKNMVARLKSTTSGNISDNISSHSVNLTSSNNDNTECHRCRTFVARDALYKCPGCGRGTPVGAKILHCLEHCAGYMNMSVSERSTCIETAGWCPIHLLGTHNLSGCNNTNDARSVCGINGCQKHHHKSLHGGTTPFIASILSTELANDESRSSNQVLLSMQTISTKSGSANCLFDNCATCCLITKNAAERLNLIGEKSAFFLRTVAGKLVIESYAYNLTLIDTDN